MYQTSLAGGFLLEALKLVGDQVVYQLGAENPLGAGLPIPKAQDCSEVVQVALSRVPLTAVSNGAGKITPVANFDGAGNQFLACKEISVADALRTPGALLFVQSSTNYPGKPANIGHVAISLGNGATIEARGKAAGTGVFSAYNKNGTCRFNKAGKIPELYQ